MGKINVLPFAVANLIAAGEVVDRPSSAIKEMLENAIDSGADRITVEIQNGGITYMRVTDNGCGMSPEDLPLCIRRHATSKIKEARDLDSIMTLGFRGEALAAIAAVSDMRIISKQKTSEIGAMLTVSVGEVKSLGERACADGTSIIVENLFANVPARRKFLKRDITESMAVNAMVEKIALSRSDIAFKLIIDGKLKLETVGDGKLKNTIYSLFGREFAAKLIEASLTVDGVSVHGYICRPDGARANRNYQNFFINGRYVKTKTALAAIEQAYTSYIASDKFPSCVLFIDINPATVDVNVHPAKLEVKFSNEKPVFEAIYYSVRNALEADTSRPEMTLSAPTPRKVSDMTAPIEEGRRESLAKRQIGSELYTAPASPSKSTAQAAGASLTSTARSDAFRTVSAEQYRKEYMGTSSGRTQSKPVEQKIDFGVSVPKVTSEPRHTPAPQQPGVFASDIPKPMPVTETDKKAETAPVEQPAPKKLSYRIIGEAFNAYVLVEQGDALLLIDKHAAHERIIFEQLKAGMNNGKRATQLLMLPIEVMMTSDEIGTLEEYRTEIEAVGFGFTTARFTASVNEIPEGITTEAVSDMLTVIAGRIKASTGTAALTRDIIFEKALYQASCKAAIKAGREYPPEYVEWIVGKLMELPDITVCPHGRPVAMSLTRKNLDYQFERS